MRMNTGKRVGPALSVLECMRMMVGVEQAMLPRFIAHRVPCTAVLFGRETNTAGQRLIS